MFEEKNNKNTVTSVDEKYEGYFKITSSAVNARKNPGGNRKDPVLFVLMQGETIHCDGEYTTVNNEIYLLVGGTSQKGYIPLKCAKKL